MSTSGKHLLGALVLILLQGCMTYSAKPITATVVDARTRQPIQGVVVVAQWQLEGGLEGGTFAGNMMVMETVTDSVGVFHFEGWGPKLKPRGTSFSAQLANADPELYLFKSGYRPSIIGNAVDMDKIRRDPRVRTSDWDGKQLPLEKFDGTLAEYADKEVWRLSSELHWTLAAKCAWTSAPKMVMTLKRQTEAFQAAGINTATFYTDLIDNEENQAKAGCSVQTFLQEHSK